MNTLNPRLQATLADLGFSPPVSTAGRLSVADLFAPTRRRGLYVLHAGDEHYIGRSENVARRFCQHLARHPDVRGLSFCAIPKGDLHPAEQAYLQELERLGFTLRNSAGMSMPMTSGSDLDDLVPVEVQRAWLAGQTIHWSGRSSDAVVRRRQERSWQAFRRRPVAAGLLGALQQYVAGCLIAPGLTELGLWSTTCFPVGGFRVNAGWQEVFRTLDGKTFFLLVAPSVLAAAYGPGWERKLARLGVKVQLQPYRYPGHDHAALYMQGVANAQLLLSRPEVQQAARVLSWRCMRKAPNPHSRSHTPQMVDFLGAEAAG